MVLRGSHNLLVNPMVPSARREFLLQSTLAFVQAASCYPGVTRIALMGSLTMPKPKPKDADVLVTLDQAVEIERLAAIGRKFKGRAQAIASGVDIFLCTPMQEYLGRLCSWRQCHPRAACTGNSYLYSR